MTTMSKLAALCLATIFLVFISSQSLFSQYADCTPDPATTDPEGIGIRSPVDMPVAFPGEHYNTVLTICAPSKANTWGVFNVTITKIQLIEMVNMPEGLTWESNTGNVDDYMYGGEKYCIIVDGTPIGTAGVKTIDVIANAWIRIIWETEAPGNPRNGGQVYFTLCNELDLELGNDISITTDDVRAISANQNDDYHTYLWQDNSTNHTYYASGSDLGLGTHKIKVTVTDTVGTTGIYSDRAPCCFKSDSIMVTVTQGNASISTEKSESFSVFPNPSDGKFFVSLNNFTKELSYEITDINGAIVFSGMLTKKESEIDLSTLKKGVYFITTNKNKREAQRIVIY